MPESKAVPEGKKQSPPVNSSATVQEKPDAPAKAATPKAAPTIEPKNHDAPAKAANPKAASAAETKARDTKAAPVAEQKNDDSQTRAADPKTTPSAEQKKSDAPTNAVAPKAAPAAEPKKPDAPAKTTVPKTAPASEAKKPDAQAKAADPKATPTTEPEKPDAPAKAVAPKAAPAAELNKPDTPTKATDPKAAPSTEPKKPEPPAKAADPKPKEAAVEPPKGVKITQIFADRLEKPSQKDLESLPVPKEGDGFSMRLHPAYFFEFLNHPFSINRETDDYKELYDSIKENGINEPIKARPREGGGLELISGHRRHDVAMQLNYPVPVVIVQADNDSAQIEVVDGNLHRKDIPTSELARAAKMKIEALSRKVGRRSKMEQLTSPQKRTDQIVAEEMGYSRTQLTRLVRIDSLVPEMKQMVDNKKLPFNVAVELSYMNQQEQQDLVGVMKKEQTVPSLVQAQQMKEASQKAAKAVKEAERNPKPTLQVVSTQAKPEQVSPQPAASTPGASLGTAAPMSQAHSTPPQPVPAPAEKPPAPVDAKKFASIMRGKPEPELKVIFTGAELKDYFPGKSPTVPEVKRTVFEALDLRKRALEKQAKKQEALNPAR